MPKYEDWIIDRIYECLNCQAIMSFTDKASRDFRKKCPLCSKNELVIKSASCGISVNVDTFKPTTLGSISDQNIRRREKEGIKETKNEKRPFWRKKDNINFKVLKEPAKYITTGKI